jgi:DNA helicase-2/ATP-dependent DNA helicase PcrA
MTYDQIVAATYRSGEKPNPDQQRAILHTKGPLLMVAGPGSGKTQTLITRTLYLLLHEGVKPEEILLCTFTEKAARELRDRLNAKLNACKVAGVDIHEMTIGTIHSVCQRIIDEYPNEAGVGVYSKTQGVGRGYLVLDELTRTFFMMDHFEAIFGPKIGDSYLGMWKGYWDAIERSQEYFDKITEEDLDLDELVKSADVMVQRIGQSMKIYRRLMIENGRVDFAHLQWLALHLLKTCPGAKAEFQSKFRHVMVDEYQDTNYIQEQLVFTLANADRNIAVVGDVDQSIYRFRGASTQNIMEFPDRVGKPALSPINLGTNYRSSQQIVDLYQAYRDEINWRGCRWPLDVEADKNLEAKRPSYKALIKIDEADAEAEAKQAIDLVLTLKRDGVITDFNQVAILLYSVREKHSGPYVQAIQEARDKGEDIDFYAPRARTYFNRPEVMCVLAGLRAVLPRVELSDQPGGYPNDPTPSIKDYLGSCVAEFKKHSTVPGHKEFATRMGEARKEIQDLIDKNGKPKKTFLHYFYDTVTTEFMKPWLDDELPARHVAQLSKLIEVFCEYYSFEWVTPKNATLIAEKFFNSFMRRLYQDGMNEYEDDEQSFPSGAVQFLTYHQSKGLEFPVVIVGSLHARVTSAKKVDDTIGSYYTHQPHEPKAAITEFDKRRLYYVAFSRAKDFLVLSGHNDLGSRVITRKVHVQGVLADCTEWKTAKKTGEYKSVQCDGLGGGLLKPVLGFTSHISAYERCPLQLKYQKLYGFVPARSEQLWMGNVVHNTLKDIHDHVLKKKPGKLNEALVKSYFEQNTASLMRSGVKPPPKRPTDKKSVEEVALESIQRYVDGNRKKIEHCRWAEKEILVDETDYTLTGVIDLLIHDDTGKVELVDFKAGRRKNNEQYREGYQDQIRLYCEQVKPKVGKYPDEAYLYWITEPDEKQIVDFVNVDPKELGATKARVQDVAKKIIQKDFPKRAKRCDDVCGICEFEQQCWPK